MKLILQILKPVEYETTDVQMDEIVYLPHPDPSPGAERLWDSWRSSPLWRTSRGIGINFVSKLEERGYDFHKYRRDFSYKVSGKSFWYLKGDIEKNWSDQASIEIWGVPKKSDDDVPVVEYTELETGKKLLLANIQPEILDLTVLPCISLGQYELEIPGRAAVDYYVGQSGIYVLSEDEFSEVLAGTGDSSLGLSEFSGKFRTGEVIGRWEGEVTDDNEDGEIIEGPWLKKLENLKSEIGRTLTGRGCIYMKARKVKSLIKKYYG